MEKIQSVKESYTSLEKLVAELDRQRESKVDFVADLRSMDVQVVERDGQENVAPEKRAADIRLTPKTTTMGEFLPRNGIMVPVKTLKQLATRLDVEVPPKFLDKMHTSHQDLLRNLLGDLMERTEKSVLVRCLDNRVRACLSDRYRCLDNFDLAFAALDVVKESNGQILKSFMNEDRFEMSFTTMELWEQFNANIRKHGKGSHEFYDITGVGDGGEKVFNPLITISNSETGRGGLSVRYGLFDRYCVNMAIVQTKAAERHLGSRMDSGLLSRETIDADAKAIMLKMRDLIKGGFHPATFGRIVNLANDAAETPIANPTTAVDNIVSDSNLSEEARDGILSHFLGDYDSTAFGLSSAISRYAQDVQGEYATEFEELAGVVLNNPKKYATA